MLIVCAAGGMVCPAVIYSLFNWSLDSQIGWGIPMATDTAFALGVLTLVRKHIPGSLLAVIVGLAIVDDVGAIPVITMFYTQEISVMHLSSAVALIAFLTVANYAGKGQSSMGIEVGGLPGLILLVLDIWAIIKTIESNGTTGSKVLWVLLILVLPVLGFILWLLLGPKKV